MLNRSAMPHPSFAPCVRLRSFREDLNWHVELSDKHQQCFVARPFSDSEIVAKYAVVLQARRHQLGLKDGEEDPMVMLPYETVQAILQELQDLFNARSDQMEQRLLDEEAWEACLTRKESGMQSPKQSAEGRFFAMIHQIFGLEVENPDVDVGAQSRDVRIKKIDGVVVLRDFLTHGVMHWNDLVRIHAFSFLLTSP